VSKSGPERRGATLKGDVSGTGVGNFAVLEYHAEAMFLIPSAMAGETHGPVLVQSDALEVQNILDRLGRSRFWNEELSAFVVVSKVLKVEREADF
jgi:hypothetical protein